MNENKLQKIPIANTIIKADSPRRPLSEDKTAFILGLCFAAYHHQKYTSKINNLILNLNRKNNIDFEVKSL
jgi:hypothetical protein